jgi:hypothetical protein
MEDIKVEEQWEKVNTDRNKSSYTENDCFYCGFVFFVGVTNVGIVLSPLCALLLVKRQPLNVFDVDVYCTMKNIHGIPT